MKNFYDFLAGFRNIIDAQALNTAAGLPPNTLGKHYRWQDGKPHGQKCSHNHLPNIVRALCQVFGSIEINGYRIIAAFDDPAIVTIQSTGRDVKIIELESSFEYEESQYRESYDDFDFAHNFFEPEKE